MVSRSHSRLSVGSSSFFSTLHPCYVVQCFSSRTSLQRVLAILSLLSIKLLHSQQSFFDVTASLTSLTICCRNSFPECIPTLFQLAINQSPVDTLCMLRKLHITAFADAMTNFHARRSLRTKLSTLRSCFGARR